MWRIVALLAIAATSVANVPPSRVSSSLVASILDAEILATEGVLHLHRHKAALLARLAANTSTGAAPPFSFEAWQDVPPPPDDIKPTFLIDRTAIDLTATTTALHLLSWRVQVPGRRRKLVDPDADNTVDLLAAARVDGVLELRDPRSLALVWQVQTRLANITSIHQAVQGSRPIVALATADGAIKVVAIRIFEQGRLRVGSYQRSSSSSKSAIDAAGTCPHAILLDTPAWAALPSTPAAVGLHVEATEFYRVAVPASLPTSILLLQVHYDVYVVVGTATGDLYVYGKQGCLVHLPPPDGNVPIRAMTALANGAGFAFAVGTRIGIAHLADAMETAPHVRVHYCTGSTDTVVSLDRDAHKSSTVYAGTSAGTILVLHLSLAHRGNSMCSVAQVLTPARHESPPSSSPVLLGPLKRLLVAVVGNRFVGFQIVDPPLAHRRFDVAVDGGDDAVALLTTKDKRQDALVILATRRANGFTHVVVYENLLVHRDPYYDISWVRTPLMVICAGGFVVWHKYRKKMRPSQIDQEEIMHVARQLQRQHAAAAE
ncbi:Aste57867_8210 [Aphanomyces stellatus]|uniref:Aste57867_8210 protein n=1 Tax=Aphanomyces stellatus TaxID=120398 RepID=A0A485KJP1_9STRA|nr:hypothetical protein As57867_008179 [Aphanomyces stellatus]VFT85097.1 Aste57867_8210 [Aphanomyces stellatus]